MRTVDHTIRLGLKDTALMGAGADGCGCRWVRCGQVCRASGKREVVIVVQVLGNREVAGTVVDAIVSDQNNAFGVMDLIPEQKIIAALRMLAYGASADQVDEIARMGKSTILESLMRFCFVIESIYTIKYLWRLTEMDLQRLLKKGEMRGAQNDLNVLAQSLMFNDVLQGKAPRVMYCVNGHKYHRPYYLAYDIYLRWTSFVSCHEGCRKDVERCFGILQAHWAIVRGDARMFDLESLRSIMMACIILHNMIVDCGR
ncbi:uncharacterized protein [Malus domestica]|uniref:uncharacterized protein n=1 Tax=Malus domestica TaxID=3750 RepID=UPI00397710CE